jgi:hypothetical protein
LVSSVPPLPLICLNPCAISWGQLGLRRVSECSCVLGRDGNSQCQVVGRAVSLICSENSRLGFNGGFVLSRVWNWKP